MAKRSSRLSYGECLGVIKDFGVRVSRSLFGGIILSPNDPRGDLFHPETPAFSEVKASGLSGGPLVVLTQLERHQENLESHDHLYSFVLYKDRGRHRGKRRNLPIRMGKNEHTLRKFLAVNARRVYRIHLSIVLATVRAHPEWIKTYQMARGPKTYLRIPPKHLEKLAGTDLETWQSLSLNPSDYQFQECRDVVRFRNYRVSVLVYRITPIVATDDSFDPEVLDRQSATV